MQPDTAVTATNPSPIASRAVNEPEPVRSLTSGPGWLSSAPRTRRRGSPTRATPGTALPTILGAGSDDAFGPMGTACQCDMSELLAAAGIAARPQRLAPGTLVFAQGAEANSVYWIHEGSVKLSVISATGKEAVVGVLGPGDFFGEGCLGGQLVRMGGAATLDTSVLVRIEKPSMQALLREQPEFAERFLAHMLARNIRMEEDLTDQLFNCSEKRLARALLLLARFGHDRATPRVMPKLSQEVLAEMVGTTRSRVNFFMNKFRTLGFIEYNGVPSVLKVHSSLMSVVLND
jgi:CRP/FNR family transcriptional regulator, cyclic AMP receptor protein